MAGRIKRIREEIIGVVSILGSIYLTLSLVTYSPWDPSPFAVTTLPVRNYGGVIGAYIVDLLFSVIGIASFTVPAVLFIYGVRRLLGKEGHWITFLGTGIFVISASMLARLITMTFHLNHGDLPGGLIGAVFTDSIRDLLSVPGAYIFTLALFLSAVILISPVSLVSLALQWKREKAERAVDESSASEVPDEPQFISLEDVDIGKERPLSQAPPVITESRLPAGRDSFRPPLQGARAIRKGMYTLPDVELLNPPAPFSMKMARDEFIASSSLLEKKLRDFDVAGKVTQVQPGPVVTMYEFEPAPGVKINRIVSLSDDLALSLKAQSVRVSTLPGKAAIGIEVPNRNRETVCLREIISSENFMKSHSKLTLALGKDIFGAPIVEDLAKMPHLLVAGATGSGKSVSVNSMVMSILFKATPKEVKMLMIDPKLLELSSYENIPHLISPVITGPKEAAEALRKMVFEMERRYRLIAEKGVRNIEAFNRIVPDDEQLPYLVVFIDELADLMFASSNEVEDSIARLAQMARASGIHLIVATQRPSVDVLTGVIKANFPARISFQVTSRIDSRTIIDTQGAEQLLGKGDMLIMLPGIRIRRVHGALVTEDEIKAVTGFIKPQGAPDYSLFEQIRVDEPEPEDVSPERDEMYQRVLEFSESVGEVSISSIQRRFKVGYNKAARIMELMEEDGFVGLPKGAGKPRDFLRRRR